MIIAEPLQLAIVLLIVALAAAILGRRIYEQFFGTHPKGCGTGCSGCPARL